MFSDIYSSISLLMHIFWWPYIWYSSNSNYNNINHSGKLSQDLVAMIRQKHDMISYKTMYCACVSNTMISTTFDNILGHVLQAWFHRTHCYTISSPKWANQTQTLKDNYNIRCELRLEFSWLFHRSRWRQIEMTTKSRSSYAFNAVKFSRANASL